VRKLDPVLDRSHSPGVGGGGGDWGTGRNCTLKSFVRFTVLRMRWAASACTLVAVREKGRPCLGRNNSRLRVDIVRAVVTQDDVVTCNIMQQSCESYGFVAVRLQIASLW